MQITQGACVIKGFIDRKKTIGYNDGTGAFRFATSARWNTMPSLRSKDAIGVSAQDISITPNTATGYYSYIETTIANGSSAVRNHTDTHTNIPGSSFQFVSDVGGTFHGAGTTINLPNDVGMGNTAVFYSEYFIYMEYDAHIRQPNEETWFNVVGSYDHSVVVITSNPGITIDGEGVSGSIGLAAGISQERRCAWFEGHYTHPN